MKAGQDTSPHGGGRRGCFLPSAEGATTGRGVSGRVAMAKVNPRWSRKVGSIKTLNWWTCCIVATLVAYLGYDHLEHTLLSVFEVSGYYYWSAFILAILSPACLAVAWLRLTGIQWRLALLLFLFVPLGAFAIWYISNIIQSMN